MSFSIQFQVTKLQEAKVANRTAVEKDKPGLAGKQNLTDDTLVHMAQSIAILTQCYGIDSLINRSGTMFWGGKWCLGAITIASWHEQVTDN